MKLKTMLHKDGPQGRAFVDYIEGSEVDHDAACAHALMLALADANEAMGRDVAWRIKTRADAMLKQWGFDTKEDA